MFAVAMGDVASAAGGAVSSTPEFRASFGLSKGMVLAAAAATLAVFPGGPPWLASGVVMVSGASVLSRVVTPGSVASDLHIDGAAQEIVARHESLVREMITLLKSEARRHAIVSSDFHVSRFEDPEEGGFQVVITQNVRTGPDEALAYWDDLGRSIQAWATSLSEEDARFLLERVAVNVDWSDGDSTVRPS